jgi:hypothetical protein
VSFTLGILTQSLYASLANELLREIAITIMIWSIGAMPHDDTISIPVIFFIFVIRLIYTPIYIGVFDWYS